jgi:RNA-directed DNA polymerase
MCREQKTEGSGCVCEGRLETESSRRARSMELLERPEGSGAEDLLSRMLERDNLNATYKRVKRNKSAAGVDGMTVEELESI